MQPAPIRVLSGDIGGTKTRLAIMSVLGTSLRTEREHTFASLNYAEFGDLLGDFLQATDRSVPAAFGIAGPVQGRVVHTTNLPWRIDADTLQRQFGFARCTLLNDLEASAYGLPALSAKDLLVLHPGAPDACGNAAVIAAGTGLGEAGLFWDGLLHRPFATEGGHASFSPGNDLEVELLRYLQRHYGHVSWERIVSGPGLVNLHEFLLSHRRAFQPDWLRLAKEQGDAAAAVADAALSARDELCAEALDWFVRLYGAEAGNLALKVMSRGGLYVGGGIAPKILTRLQHRMFLDAFFDKGRMRPLLEAMPVKVILNDRAALYGSALVAGRR